MMSLAITPDFWVELLRLHGTGHNFGSFVVGKSRSGGNVFLDKDSFNPLREGLQIQLYFSEPIDLCDHFVLVHEISVKKLLVTYSTHSVPKNTIDLTQHTSSKLQQTQLDLNLSIMNKRLGGAFDLAKLKTLRVLFCGSGTLAHHMSTILLTWGVRSMTFIDNGIVSRSNLLRQPLFKERDISKLKAHVTAKSLDCLVSDGNFKGLNVTIPYTKSTGQDNDILEDLIKECDVVVCVTDTRASRYAPTFLARKLNKVCLSAAVGIDTFTIVRTDSDLDSCYFCSDVTGPHYLDAPSEELRCTISRPGLAPLCAGLAVEMLIDSIAGKRQCPQQIRSTGLYNLVTSNLVSRNPKCVCCGCTDKTLDTVFDDPSCVEETLEDTIDYSI